MKNTATYGMTNVTIEKEVHSNVTSYMVYADTERFGQHQIMAQCISKEEAEQWCKENGVTFELPTAFERVEQVIAEGWSKVQIGNVMYHNLYIEDGHIFGHSGTWGWRDITKFINECRMVSNDIGKTKEYFGKYHEKSENRTVKFGKACTF